MITAINFDTYTFYGIDTDHYRQLVLAKKCHNHNGYKRYTISCYATLLPECRSYNFFNVKLGYYLLYNCSANVLAIKIV